MVAPKKVRTDARSDRTNNLYNGGIPPITQRTKDTPLGKEGIEQSSPPPPLVVITYTTEARRPITQRTKDTPLGKEGIEQSSPPPPLVVIKGRGSPRTTRGLGEHPAFYYCAI